MALSTLDTEGPSAEWHAAPAEAASWLDRRCSASDELRPRMLRLSVLGSRREGSAGPFTRSLSCGGNARGTRHAARNAPGHQHVPCLYPLAGTGTCSGMMWRSWKYIWLLQLQLQLQLTDRVRVWSRPHRLHGPDTNVHG